MGFMKGIFGPSKDEVWRQFASEIGGEYIDQGFWKAKKLVMKIGSWTIVMDTLSRSSGKQSTTYTRIRAAFKTIDGLKFKISKRNIFSGIFGGQDIQTGYTKLDEDFVIRGGPEDKIKEILSDEKIRQVISKQLRNSIEIKDDKGVFNSNLVKGSYELYFEEIGVVKDIDRLSEIFLLFGLVLNKLVVINSALELDIYSESI